MNDVQSNICIQYFFGIPSLLRDTELRRGGGHQLTLVGVSRKSTSSSGKHLASKPLSVLPLYCFRRSFLIPLDAA
jgi:hypothetical protein